MTGLEQRGRELREAGRTSLTTFRTLRNEYPHAEWFDLWVAAGEGPSGITPTWAMNGSSPAEARYRNDPREETPRPTAVTIDRDGNRSVSTLETRGKE